MLEDLTGRQPGLVRDRGGDRSSHAEAQQCAKKSDRADLGAPGQRNLPAAGTAREQSPPFSREPPAQADRRDEREPEQERAQLAADEDEAVGRDAAPVEGAAHLRIRAAQPHGRVGGDRRLGA